MSAATLKPDRAEIRRALEVLHAPEQIIELRALHKGRKRTDAGYFDGEHRDRLIEEAARLNKADAAVYVTLNQLDPQLLARHANRVQQYAQATTTDANVTCRSWLLIDVDPQRPKDTSATDEQLEAAIERARQVRAYLNARGWPEPLEADSGNGAHLLYRVALPNDDASRDLVKGCLEVLAARFDNDVVKIDRGVFNAARIVKCYGTVANKGDNLPSAPWRLSRLRTVPTSLGVVTVEQLQALAAEAAPGRARPHDHDRTYTGDGGAWTSAQVEAFLARAGLEAPGPEPYGDGLMWKLKRCPFNPEHVNGEAAVFLGPDGKLGFKCQHNSCADRHWTDLREHVDGARKSRARNRKPPTEPETEVIVVTLANVPSKTLVPLWPNKLWRGKLAMLAGDPGLGKSLATLDIAARITRGALWPASVDRAPIGDVVILSAEDDAADTLRPRLEACGADLGRVHAIIEVIERDPESGKPRRKSFRLGPHLEHLERLSTRYRPLLLIIDPITAYMSLDTDSHANADVRSDLAPLAELGQRHGVAVLMVSHLNKATTMQALYRVTGSVAFVAAARSAFGVIRDPEDKQRRYVLPLKNNLGKDTGGLAYRIEVDRETPRIAWESATVDVDIDEVTAAATPRERAKQSAVSGVAEWLREQLKAGPVPTREIWRRAGEAGHSKRRMYAAMRELAVVNGPAGFGGAWHYSLPETPESSPGAPGSQNTCDSGEDCGISGDDPVFHESGAGKTANFSGNSEGASDAHANFSGNNTAFASRDAEKTGSSPENGQSSLDLHTFCEPGVSEKTGVNTDAPETSADMERF